MSSLYDIDDVAELGATFRDASTNALVDPTTLTMTVKRPDGTVTIYTYGTSAEVSRTSLGLYRALIPLTAAGDWGYRWKSTGSGAGAQEGSLTVRPSVVAVDTPASIEPTRADVGALMRARTKDTNGNELGTFNDDTRPTGNQVDFYIGSALEHVRLRLGTRIPARATVSAKLAVALRAAYTAELSLWPEQNAAAVSVYSQLKTLYDELMMALQDSLLDSDAATTSRISSASVVSPTLGALPRSIRQQIAALNEV